MPIFRPVGEGVEGAEGSVRVQNLPELVEVLRQYWVGIIDAEVIDEYSIGMTRGVFGTNANAHLVVLHCGGTTVLGQLDRPFTQW